VHPHVQPQLPQLRQRARQQQQGGLSRADCEVCGDCGVRYNLMLPRVCLQGPAARSAKPCPAQLLLVSVAS
jgi:hypothetical protein